MSTTEEKSILLKKNEEGALVDVNSGCVFTRYAIDPLARDCDCDVATDADGGILERECDPKWCPRFSDDCAACERQVREEGYLNMDGGETYCLDCVRLFSDEAGTVLEMFNRTDIMTVRELSSYNGGKWVPYPITDTCELSYSDVSPLSRDPVRALQDGADLYAIVRYTSGSDYGGSLVEQSNYRSWKREFSAGQGVYWWSLCGGHGSFGILVGVNELAAQEPDTIEAVTDVLRGLDRYPLMDDEDHSMLEMQTADDDWSGWAEYEYRRALENHYSISDLEWADGSEETVREMFEVVRERLNIYWENEGSSQSMHVDVARVAMGTPIALLYLIGATFNVEEGDDGDACPTCEDGPVISTYAIRGGHECHWCRQRDYKATPTRVCWTCDEMRAMCPTCLPFFREKHAREARLRQFPYLPDPVVPVYLIKG